MGLGWGGWARGTMTGLDRWVRVAGDREVGRCEWVGGEWVDQWGTGRLGGPLLPAQPQLEPSPARSNDGRFAVVQSTSSFPSAHTPPAHIPPPQEDLVTMAVPFDHPEVAELIEKINIPVVLVGTAGVLEGVGCGGLQAAGRLFGVWVLAAQGAALSGLKLSNHRAACTPHSLGHHIGLGCQGGGSA